MKIDMPSILLVDPYSAERARDEIAQRKPWLNYQSQKSEDGERLSVKEVAGMLGKSEKTIRRWTEREHEPLPAIKIFCGKKFSWSFEKLEVLEWVSLHRQS